jgi:antirestriction protein
MDTDLDLMEARIYVGTYAKYNSGSIMGRWLDVFDYDSREEFFEACRELHGDEKDPEFMFQDYENIPSGLISEGWMSKNFFTVMEELNNLEGDLLKPFLIWVDNFGYKLSEDDYVGISGLLERFRDAYRGEYASEEAFAEEVVSEQYELPEFSLRYFDYEAFARDLFIGDYWYSEGHVFLNS